MDTLPRVAWLWPAIVLSMTLFGCGGADNDDGSEPVETFDRCAEGNGTFEKPDNPLGNNPFLDSVDAEGPGSNRWGWSYRNFARPHMGSYSGKVNWLYEGEHFVMDLGWRTYGAGDLEGTMMVLLNFEPVPFKLIEVDSPDGYPEIEELELEDENTLAAQKAVMINDGEAFNFTLAVPSTSFAHGNGTYDMRVVTIPRGSPSEKLGFDPRLAAIPAFAYQVHYGGCQPTGASSMRKIDGELVSWTPMAKSLLAESDYLFLAPPSSVSSWEEEAPNEVMLDRLFATSQETLQLTLYSLLTSFEKERGVNLDEVVYMVFEDEQIIDTFRMQPNYESQSATREFYRSEDRRVAARIEIPATSTNSAQYTVAAFLNPGDVPAPMSSLGTKMSNTLFFEFATP